MKYNVKKVAIYFSFDFGWYSVHFDIVHQEQGSLLDRQNLLSVIKVICQQSLKIKTLVYPQVLPVFVVY